MWHSLFQLNLNNGTNLVFMSQQKFELGNLKNNWLDSVVKSLIHYPSVFVSNVHLYSLERKIFFDPLVFQTFLCCDESQVLWGFKWMKYCSGTITVCCRTRQTDWCAASAWLAHVPHSLLHCLVRHHPPLLSQAPAWQQHYI